MNLIYNKNYFEIFSGDFVRLPRHSRSRCELWVLTLRICKFTSSQVKELTQRNLHFAVFIEMVANRQAKPSPYIHKQYQSELYMLSVPIRFIMVLTLFTVSLTTLPN